MGVSHSTAKYLAPASFLFFFAAQQYGVLSSPNMKDIHDANLAAFSPHPFAIAAFFFPQQIFQLAWLYRLWRGQGDRAEVQQMVDYVPYYIIGNVCLGTWMFFWNANDLKVANIFVVTNTIAQLSFMMTGLKPMSLDSTNSILTHVVVKSFAGIGVLDLLHNTSAAYFKDVAPNTLVKVLTGIGFAGAASMSDWIFGGCLAYNLVGLAAGQRGSWRNLLGAYAVGTAGIVAARNWAYPAYVQKTEEVEYEGVGQDEEGPV